ncbi:MAG: SDR family oxidoreductase [Phycisphaerae bacterium]|nr:SDR family oxidoreductase [Gemmatimonadaceae bacterium]
MTTLRGKTALVIGGSSGVGEATARMLLSEGVRVTAVARGAERLQLLEAELGDGFGAIVGDASDPAFAAQVLGEILPDLLIISAGVPAQTGVFDAFDWDSFSAAWNSDLKISFHFMKQAFALPLRPGSTIVMVSSGASINGSPLSGGYAGAKRMQWLLAGYAQKQSDERQLGLRTIAVLPTQLIEGSVIAAGASKAYGAMAGITAEEFMNRIPFPLTNEKVATAIVGALRGELPLGTTAIGVSGNSIDPLK